MIFCWFQNMPKQSGCFEQQGSMGTLSYHAVDEQSSDLLWCFEVGSFLINYSIFGWMIWHLWVCSWFFSYVLECLPYIPHLVMMHLLMKDPGLTNDGLSWCSSKVTAKTLCEAGPRHCWWFLRAGWPWKIFKWPWNIFTHCLKTIMISRQHAQVQILLTRGHPDNQLFWKIYP